MDARDDAARSDAAGRADAGSAEERAATFAGIATSIPTGVVACDPEALIVWANPAAAALFGRATEDLLGHALTVLLATESHESLRAIWPRVVAGQHTTPCLLVGLRGDGETFDLSATAGVRRDDRGRPVGVTVILHDVTDELATERELSEVLARFRAIAETAQEGILAVSQEGEPLFANERLAEILAMPLDEVYALARQRMVAGEDLEDIVGRLFHPAPGERRERYDVHYDRPNGDPRVLSVSASALRADDGSVLGSLAMVSDVTDQRSAETRLRHQALHDPLTDLPNRLLFTDRLSTAKARHERSGGRGTAVVFLDLDDFKEVNDTYGHVIGDSVLAAVAGRLEDALRDTDTVARIGGDEFAVICEDADAVVATEVAARIQAALETPIEADGHAFRIKASAGVALSPPEDVADLLRLADRAMYRAKTSSDTAICVYGEDAR
jgi:diguanylate cyclase (GGDEF)-like protein/PAS domain S-box-containing protein